MADDAQRTCVECQGTMAPIVIMDKSPGVARRLVFGPLEYRLPDDQVSFWTGRYPTAGVVRAFLCAGCGRIALYGDRPDAEPASQDGGA
jgi:hypothetical protein